MGCDWYTKGDKDPPPSPRPAHDALDYNKYLACVKGWLPDRTKERRVKWATVMLNRYPQPEDWYRVRFSDEVHFGYGPEGQLRITRKPGTLKTS